MTERAAPTYPHDYRLIAGGDVKTDDYRWPSGQSLGDRVAKTFSRAFQVLTNRKTRDGLAKAQVDPTTIIPPEFANSPIATIRNAYVHQFPRVRGEKR